MSAMSLCICKKGNIPIYFLCFSFPVGERRFDRSREPPKKGNTVYVFGLGITEEILSRVFSKIGKVLNIHMEKEKK